MKRLASIIMILAAITVTVNAQFFVEGSMGARYNTGRSIIYPINGDPSNIYFNISPLAGYRFNDKIAAGIKASIVRQKETMVYYRDTDDEVELVRRAPGWSFAVFGRFKLLGTKKISFLVETSAYISENKTIDNILPSFYRINRTNSTIGINMLPLVICDLSDKWSIKATGDFLSLDLSSESVRNNDSGSVFKYNHFGFTGQSAIFRNLSNISIGFIYHFKKSGK